MTAGYFVYDIVGNTTPVYNKQCFTLKVPESRGLSGHISIHLFTTMNYWISGINSNSPSEAWLLSNYRILPHLSYSYQGFPQIDKTLPSSCSALFRSNLASRYEASVGTLWEDECSRCLEIEFINSALKIAELCAPVVNPYLFLKDIISN